MKEIIVIGIIGAAKAEKRILDIAEQLGRLIAKNQAILITGGLSGVMEYASKGAYMEGGITVGILPGNRKENANPYISVPIATGLGEMRNVLIVRACDVLIAVGGEYGTLSEIAFALKTGKRVIGINTWDIPGIISVSSPEEAIKEVFAHIRLCEK